MLGCGFVVGPIYQFICDTVGKVDVNGVGQECSLKKNRDFSLEF